MFLQCTSNQCPVCARYVLGICPLKYRTYTGQVPDIYRTRIGVAPLLYTCYIEATHWIDENSLLVVYETRYSLTRGMQLYQKIHGGFVKKQFNSLL